MKTAFVYWLHLPEHTNILVEGYIGVSVDPRTRKIRHITEAKSGRHENPHITNAYNKYGDRIIQTVLFQGVEDYCYEMEYRLRPSERIGWNINSGGTKPPSREGKKFPNQNTITWSTGLTKETDLRLENISKNNSIRMKERIKNGFKTPTMKNPEILRQKINMKNDPSMVDRVLKTRYSKQWKITSPNNDITIVINLMRFCKENNFKYDCFQYASEKNIITYNGYKVERIPLCQ